MRPVLMMAQPRCVCVSTSAGITVFPVRSTRAAPAGAATFPLRPTAVILAFSIRNAEFSMGTLPSPVMSRAPSNSVAEVSGGCAAGREQAAVSRKQQESTVTNRIQAPLYTRLALRWHRQERVHRMPECLAMEAEHYGMRHSRQHHELAVAAREL